MKKIIRLSWYDYERCVFKIINYLSESNFKPDSIIAIQRGGFVPAVQLAHSLGLRDVKILNIARTNSDVVNADKHKPVLHDTLNIERDKTYLVVDDIIGSGETYIFAKSLLENAGVSDFIYVSLTMNKDNLQTDLSNESNLFIAETYSGWIVFPWEKDTSIISSIPDKVVIAWSGGIDSTMMMHYVLANYKDTQVCPFFVNRGQLNLNNELEAVSKLENFFKRFNNYTSCFKVKSDIPPSEIKAVYPDGIKERKGYVLRNSSLVNLAVMYAVSIGAKAVLLGSNSDDVFPGSKRNFWKLKKEEVKSGLDDDSFDIIPLLLELNFSKKDVIKWSKEHNTPISDCWFCWKNGDKPCGRCQACLKVKHLLMN